VKAEVVFEPFIVKADTVLYFSLCFTKCNPKLWTNLWRSLKLNSTFQLLLLKYSF